MPNLEIAKRNEKVAFFGVKGEGDAVTYHRMRGFTEFTKSSNPKEYSRQYVDEAFEQTDVVGYSPSISYGFDYSANEAVHQDIKNITDNELCGSAAVRSIVIVDLTKESTTKGTYAAVMREFAVIPDSEGDNMDAYTYSGTLKVKGENVIGTATTTDEWQTLTFTPTAAEE